MMNKPLSLTLCFCLLISCNLFAGPVYKYKDENGNWAFTDKKPKQKAEEVSLKSGSKSQRWQPDVWVDRQGEQYHLMVDSPIHAPVQIEVLADKPSPMPQMFSIDKAGKHSLYQSPDPIPAFRFRWGLGEPSANHSASVYELPFSSKKRHLITQGFNGRFSHQHRGSRHAIDIAMQIGTDIAAAREGIVAIAKDDYHMGGAKRFFLDKANHITVLHEDGTFAIYAHILQGSAKVKAGDKVTAGQLLARSGSSGYSTGPHLHFVIQRNASGRTLSESFSLRDKNGRTFTPRAGMKI